MLTAAVLTPLLLTGTGQLPDALDHLRSAQIKPNISLVLDSSGSMQDSVTAGGTQCNYFAAAYNGGSLSFDKNTMMRAVLTGCRISQDGLLDRWYDRANFSISRFGNGSFQVLAPFGSSLSSLESAVLGVPASGNTPMSLALGSAGQMMSNYFKDSNSLSCRPNYVLLLSDGNPNASSADFSFACNGASVSAPASQPWKAAYYMNNSGDMLCSLSGDQPISTYSIGFGDVGSFSPSNLQNIAQDGGGEYFYASDYAQLEVAFESIVLAMASRAGLFYSAPAIQNDGLFAGNYIYSSSFKPAIRGRWRGTVKKHCILPERLPSGKFDTNQTNCLFKSKDGDNLLTNPEVEDLWTNTATTAADVGGAGALMLDRLGSPGSAPKTPYRPRNIVTWRPGTQAYVPVQPATWTADDSWSSPLQHDALLNLLHGYVYAADYQTGNPLAVDRWPMGDPVHSPTAIIRYADDCDQPKNCYLVVGANDGMIHFFDAANGQETQALIPSELWTINGISKQQLRNLPRQPDVDTTHRYFVDGGLSLFHEDLNGDGIVQVNETAYLVITLGRGGSALYKIPMNQFNGVLDVATNPIYTIAYEPTNGYKELEELLGTPWLGQMNVQGGKHNVAIFSSGHIGDFDQRDWPQPSQAPTHKRVPGNAKQNACEGNNASFRDWFPVEFCNVYDNKGYPDPVPLNYTIGPFKATFAQAYRFRFLAIDLDPDDKVILEDEQGFPIMDVSQLDDKTWSSWAYAEQFYLRIITDGDGNPQKYKGFKIGQIDYLFNDEQTFRDHHPSVFMTDLDKWSGTNAFERVPNEDGMLIQISKQCSGSPAICVDSSNNPDLKEMSCPLSSDISVYTVGERVQSIYFGDECGQIWKAYAVDEAGTDWKARRVIALNDTLGKLDQLANVTDPNSGKGCFGKKCTTITPGSLIFAGGLGQSKDFRKIFRRLDIVATTCPGRRAIGLYFGTGNIQRPAAFDELENPALNNGRDIVGVVWDFPDLPSGLDSDALADVSSINEIDPRKLYASGKYGWYMNLRDNERMLRDPLVFEGLVYFKTYEPVRAATECSVASGQDRIYIMNSCSAEAFLDQNNNGQNEPGEREAWRGDDDVGGNLLLITPNNEKPIVTAGSMTSEQQARIAEYSRGRVPSIFSWREPKLY